MNVKMKHAIEAAGLNIGRLSFRTGLGTARLEVILKQAPLHFERPGTAPVIQHPDPHIRQQQKAESVIAAIESRPTRREARLIAAACGVEPAELFGPLDQLNEPDGEPRLRPWPWQIWSGEEVARRVYQLEQRLDSMGRDFCRPGAA